MDLSTVDLDLGRRFYSDNDEEQIKSGHCAKRAIVRLFTWAFHIADLSNKGDFDDRAGWETALTACSDVLEWQCKRFLLEKGTIWYGCQASRKQFYLDVCVAPEISVIYSGICNAPYG